MTPHSLILIGIDIVAIATLTLGLYYRRHHRRDLVVAFMGVNIGVLAVASVLGTADVAAGLGLGLFGVLSIIRLRSSEISQREVAYYFAALALGLIAGLPATDYIPVIALSALILAVMWIADHPGLFARSRQQVVRLDQAVTDENELRAQLGERLGATVLSMIVQEVDYVNDTTLVDVRYRQNPTRPSSRDEERTLTANATPGTRRSSATVPGGIVEVTR